MPSLTAGNDSKAFGNLPHQRVPELAGKTRLPPTTQTNEWRFSLGMEAGHCSTPRRCCLYGGGASGSSTYGR
jgi:hypothetical protein